MRRYLFENDSARKKVRRQVQRSGRGKNKEVRAVNWVRLPIHYVPQDEQKVSSEEGEEASRTGTNKFLPQNAVTDATTI